MNQQTVTEHLKGLIEQVNNFVFRLIGKNEGEGMQNIRSYKGNVIFVVLLMDGDLDWKMLLPFTVGIFP